MSSSSVSSKPTIPSSLPTTSEVEIIRPCRPGFGTLGTRIQVLANVYPVDFNSQLIIYHYDVTISPTQKATTANRLLFKEWVNQQVNSMDETMSQLSQLCIYDGQKSLFSPRPLDIDATGKTFILSLNGDVAVLDLFTLSRYLSNDHPKNISVEAIDYPRDRIAALEILFRHVPSSKFPTFGKGGGSFFSPTRASPLRDGLEVHFGWRQSLRPSLGPFQQGGAYSGISVTYKQLLLNIDVAASAFYQAGPLSQVISNFFRVNDINSCRDYLDNPNSKLALERHLKQVIIDINYRGGRKRYKIKNLSKGSTIETIVEFTDPPRRISVAQYFKEHYNISLKYPWLPCVNCGTNKDVYIPMELCNVKENQRHLGKLSDLQVADMIKVTAVPPSDRQNRIQDGIRQLHGDKDAEKFLESWGVKVDKNMILSPARILPSPKMTFNPKSEGGHTITIRDGSWRYDQSRSLAIPESIETWGVAVFGSPNQIRSNDVEAFVKGLVSSLQALGMKVNTKVHPKDLITYSRRNEETKDTLAEAKRKIQIVNKGSLKVDLILCILPSPSTFVYGSIKKAAETSELNVMTQCCLSKHVRDDPKRKRPYFMNLALKINAKLGGINAFLNPSAELPPIGPSRVPTMIIGADVTHPAPGTDEKSIAAMVGSMDARYCEYRTNIRFQKGRKEIINDIDNMVKELFLMFRDRHKVFPQRVLMYRDGVSEGQFAEVVYTEVTKLKKMFKNLNVSPIPALTFVVMNKRHHVRFFGINKSDMDNKGNLRAGTVIDSHVTHPFEFDFFLYSHPGLQGTSRPSHYHVLFDENGFTADTLQELTYRLCYLFCRSTRAVSMVPPAYYAHLVAARARCYDGKGISEITQEMKNKMFFV